MTHIWCVHLLKIIFTTQDRDFKPVTPNGLTEAQEQLDEIFIWIHLDLSSFPRD